MQALRIFFASLLALCPLGAAAAEGAHNVDELMRKSGLWAQIGQIPGHIRAGAQEARGQTKTDKPGSSMSDEQYGRLVSAMNAAFAPNRMREWVAAELAASLTVEDERAALDWLTSDLGFRITRLEEQGSEVENYQRAQREGPAILAALPPARLAKFTRLAAITRAGESSADLVINVTSAVIYGAQLSMGALDSTPFDKIHAQLQAGRPQMVKALTQESIKSFAYAYRGLGDAEIERYVAFNDSRPGRSYNAAALRALNKAMSRGALEMGRSLGAMPPGEPRRAS